MFVVNYGKFTHRFWFARRLHRSRLSSADKIPPPSETAAAIAADVAGIAACKTFPTVSPTIYCFIRENINYIQNYLIYIEKYRNYFVQFLK